MAYSREDIAGDVSFCEGLSISLGRALKRGTRPCSVCVVVLSAEWKPAHDRDSVRVGGIYALLRQYCHACFLIGGSRCFARVVSLVGSKNCVPRMRENAYADADNKLM